MNEENMVPAEEGTEQLPDELAGMVEGGAPVADGEEAPKKKKGGRKKKEKAPKEKKPLRDNVALINAMESISDVRRALQVCVAKKAKSHDNPTSVARYDAEIEAAKAKLAAMLEANTTVEELIAAKEEPNRIISAYIKTIEARFAQFNTEHPVSKRLQKSINDDLPEAFYNELPTELHELLNQRHEKCDYRLRASCRNMNLMQAFEDGTIKFEDGDWKDADGNIIGRKVRESKEEETEAADEAAE